jgi:sister chromatid cohesion protein DCC1
VAEEEEDADMDRGLNVEGTVTSIAKCGSTLELHTPPEGFSVTGVLSAAARVFGEGVELDGNGDVDVDVDMQGDQDRNTRKILDELFADIPVSKAQCKTGWAEMCGFVIPPRDGATLASPVSSYCWRPSAAKKLEVWKMIVDGAVLQGIDLGKQFLVRDLWRSVLDDDDGNEPFPKPLFEAVVRRIRESGDGAGGDLKCECGFFCGFRD